MFLQILMLGLMLVFSNVMPVVAEEITEEQKELAAEKINAGIEASKQWLAIVDEGQYEKSWNEAAQLFKDKVPSGQWETSLNQIRTPLGKVHSREVLQYQYLTSVPGAPKGEFVVIQFKTSFEQKPNSVETITPMLDSDGQWRVSGYYIK
jgi:hypothetical protein